MRRIQTTPVFARDLRKLSPSVRPKLEALIQRIATSPRDPNLSAKKLVGISPTQWRVRLGQYRLVFEYTKTTLTLHRIRHRKDVYRGL